MLVDVKIKAAQVDHGLVMVLGILAGGVPVKRLDKGLYQIGHFNFEHLLGLRSFPDFKRIFFSIPGHVHGNTGVADTPEQLLAKLGTVLENDRRQLVVSVTHVAKVPGEESGWRWHKWGQYIGDSKPTCEYLADEPDFDNGVYVFHVYDVTGLPCVQPPNN